MINYKVIVVGTWWCLVSIGQYGLIHDASSMLLGQHEAELIDTRRYWLVFGCDGSVWGCTGWYLVVLGQYNLVLLGIK